MMLDKLKSLFVVTENNKNTKETDTLETNDSTTKGEVSKETINTPKNTSSSVQGNLNNKIMEKLLKVIADNNMEGFDYIEFKNSIKALEKLPLDEKTKFRSAFATAQTMGFTVPKLLDSIKFYQKVLGNEDAEFTKAINHQLNSKIGNKKEEIEKFSEMIAAKSAQVKKLTEEISRHQKHIDEVKNKIETDSISIEQTRKDFETTYYKLKYQINEDVKKVKDYLE